MSGPPDYAGWAALILAIGLVLVLLVVVIAGIVFGVELNESAQRLLTTIGAGLVGALAAYIGSGRRRGGGDGDPRP
jgi:hypothetical protein